MSEKVFVFPEKERIATIDLEDLSQSVIVRAPRSNDPGPSRPLQHWQLISRIHEMANKHNAEFTQEEIWVEKGSSVRMSNKDEDATYNWNETNTPVNKWLFDHVLTKINLVPGQSSKEYNPAVAISYNKRGIQVVWGLNVKVCKNLSIFGENCISTYGPEKSPFEKQMELLEFWITKMEEKFASDVEIAEQMKKTVINQNWINEAMGDLYIKAIKRAYTSGSDRPHAPVNTTVLSSLVQKMNIEDVSTIWDFYNAGTAVIKPGNVKVDEVVGTNMAWGKFLSEKV